MPDSFLFDIFTGLITFVPKISTPIWTVANKNARYQNASAHLYVFPEVFNTALIRQKHTVATINRHNTGATVSDIDVLVLPLAISFITPIFFRQSFIIDIIEFERLVSTERVRYFTRHSLLSFSALYCLSIYVYFVSSRAAPLQLIAARPRKDAAGLEYSRWWGCWEIFQLHWSLHAIFQKDGATSLFSVML